MPDSKVDARILSSMIEASPCRARASRRPALTVVALLIAFHPAAAQIPKASYNDSIVVAPLYVEYTKVSDEKFAAEVQELQSNLGQAPHVLLGFSTFLSLEYNAEPNMQRPIDESVLAPTVREVDLVVRRAAANGIIAHVALTSGFFHGWNRLR